MKLQREIKGTSTINIEDFEWEGPPELQRNKEQSDTEIIAKTKNEVRKEMEPDEVRKTEEERRKKEETRSRWQEVWKGGVQLGRR